MKQAHENQLLNDNVGIKYKNDLWHEFVQKKNYKAEQNQKIENNVKDILSGNEDANHKSAKNSSANKLKAITQKYIKGKRFISDTNRLANEVFDEICKGSENSSCSHQSGCTKSFVRSDFGKIFIL